MASLREELSEVIHGVNWTYVAHCLGKSNSWLYHKLNGIDGNKKESKITPQDRTSVADVLEDLADRLMETSLKLRQD